MYAAPEDVSRLLGTNAVTGGESSRGVAGGVSVGFSADAMAV